MKASLIAALPLLAIAVGPRPAPSTLTGTEPLRIYTVYTPPNHLDGRVHPAKVDATKDKADEAFGAGVR
jgi:hypothetical protein